MDNTAKYHTLHRHIAGWVRQNRHRAKQQEAVAEVTVGQVLELYRIYDYKCALCGEPAGSPDLLFPIRNKAPFVLANILPCCDGCRTKKRGIDIVRFYQDGGIAKSKLLSLMADVISRDGNELVKQYLQTNYSL